MKRIDRPSPLSPTRRSLMAGAGALGLYLAVPAIASATDAAKTAMPPETESWTALKSDVFGDRPLLDGTGILDIGAPYRAEDAAIVPITLDFTLPPGDTRRIARITLVIDENPAPVAAVFTLGEAAGVSHIETRVRINAYSHVHAVAEASDGSLYVVARYVKAAGGCSAPAGKDQALARAEMGKMRFRSFAPAEATSGPEEAQLMIRHPNNSGLQKDQVTLNYIPAHFIDEVTISQGSDMILKMEGGISISEDPNFRFAYVPNGAETVSVSASDTDGNVFTAEWPRASSEG
nr:quinoprotein dehydrogenase-associated SoxYZ-like carrier [Methylobrevis albus]